VSTGNFRNRWSQSATSGFSPKIRFARKFWICRFPHFAAAQLACSLMSMANQALKPKSSANVRYTWRPEVAVTWAVVRLNEDGSETSLGSEKHKEIAMRWAAMLDRAAQEDVSKRRTKKARVDGGLPQAEPSPQEFADSVKPPDQQIAFPWNLFSRRSA
jgi:hypothetical protein